MQRLTDGELEILRLGFLSIKEAANLLGLSEGTVRNMRSSIIRKYSANNYYHAIVISKLKYVTNVMIK